VTQFFFDVSDYEQMLEQLSRLKVDKPVVPGIMPVTSLSSIPRMAVMGAPVPPDMVARLESADSVGGAESVRQAGIEASTNLCQRLLDNGAPGLHFYTLNRSTATREIYAALGLGPSVSERVTPAAKR
jgi:methylenetetrahydrofolate reductase (NADPH)